MREAMVRWKMDSTSRGFARKSRNETSQKAEQCGQIKSTFTTFTGNLGIAVHHSLEILRKQ